MIDTHCYIQYHNKAEHYFNKVHQKHNSREAKQLKNIMTQIKHARNKQTNTEQTQIHSWQGFLVSEKADFNNESQS